VFLSTKIRFLKRTKVLSFGPIKKKKWSVSRSRDEVRGGVACWSEKAAFLKEKNPEPKKKATDVVSQRSCRGKGRPISRCQKGRGRLEKAGEEATGGEESKKGPNQPSLLWKRFCDIKRRRLAKRVRSRK